MTLEKQSNLGKNERCKKGKEPPEFMSTHPSSDNRINNIQGMD